MRSKEKREFYQEGNESLLLPSGISIPCKTDEHKNEQVEESNKSPIGFPYVGSSPLFTETLVHNKDEKIITKNNQIISEKDLEKNTVNTFWNTQPVPKMFDKIQLKDIGPIDSNCDIDKVRKEPYKLPEGFIWSECDVFDSNEIDEIYTLLHENYVEDDDAMFRFDYKREFLRWALSPPNYVKEWHVSVRVKSTNKMVGFITGIPARLHINDTEMDAAEINFLCVHKKLRSKRLAPVLIKEITRRVNLKNKWQAVYTAGTNLPKPIAKCQYWHRSLNPKKLIEVGFSPMGVRMTMSRTIKFYRVNKSTQIPGLRKMEEKDVLPLYHFFNDYLKKYKLYPVLSKEEVAHWLLPRDNVIYSYVQYNDEGKLANFLSFYSLPSTVIRKEKHSSVNVAYSYYNIATTVDLKVLISDALTIAKNEGFDVYNALDLMNNSQFLKDLKFGSGDGCLYFYFYNWKSPELSNSDVGLVLL